MKTVLVSAVALIDIEGRVLLAQRPEGKSMAGLWEFPGGKVEPGESPTAALGRELGHQLPLPGRADITGQQQAVRADPDLQHAGAIVPAGRGFTPG